MSAIAKRSYDEPTLVAVDGLAGSGKSTMASALCEGSDDQRVTVVTADEFYQPETRDWASWTARQGYERFFDHQRLEEELLQALHQGLTARFSTYDWTHRRPGQDRTVEPEGIVVVEGVYLLKPRLRDHWDASIWVETPKDVRERRLRARGEGDTEWIKQWMRAEDLYVRIDAPAHAATWIVPGS